MSVQPPTNPTDPTQLRPQPPDNIPQGNPSGTLKTPGQPDQHGTVEPPQSPNGPYIFKQDLPGSKPATFVPENTQTQVPGTYFENPPSFKV